MTWPRSQSDSFPARMLTRMLRAGPWGLGGRNQGKGKAKGMLTPLTPQSHFLCFKYVRDRMSFLILFSTASLMSWQTGTERIWAGGMTVSSGGRRDHGVLWAKWNLNQSRRARAEGASWEEKPRTYSSFISSIRSLDCPYNLGPSSPFYSFLLWTKRGFYKK